MARIRYSLGPIIGYHGCDQTVAEKVLSNKTPLNESNNDYDWLGPGTYFWVDSPERGYEWALRLSQRKKSQIKHPTVIGAFIHPGLCLNLTDYGVMDEIKSAYDLLYAFSQSAGIPLPENRLQDEGVFLQRHLDCAVIKTVHELRKKSQEPAYDSVYGVFEEGKALFNGSGFREKSHVQIAVRNLNCIIGYFRVPGY